MYFHDVSGTNISEIANILNSALIFIKLSKHVFVVSKEIYFFWRLRPFGFAQTDLYSHVSVFSYPEYRPLLLFSVSARKLNMLHVFLQFWFGNLETMLVWSMLNLACDPKFGLFASYFSILVKHRARKYLECDVYLLQKNSIRDVRVLMWQFSVLMVCFKKHFIEKALRLGDFVFFLPCIYLYQCTLIKSLINIKHYLVMYN